MKVTKKMVLVVIMLTGFLIFFGCSSTKTPMGTAVTISKESAEKVKKTDAIIPKKGEEKTSVPETAYVRDILFDTLKGKECISILLSELPPFTITRDSENTLLVKLEKMFIPKDLRKRYGEGQFDNIKFVFPFQRIEAGKQLACIKIDVKKMVPYRVRKDESGIIAIDFDVSSLPSTLSATGSAKPAADTKAAGQYEAVREKEAEKIKSGTEKQPYWGKLISLELQNATLNSAFRLISEVSGMNIVAAPDVLDKTMTLCMKNIPWDQAFDAVLEVNGLGKKESGTVITVLPLEELKKAEEEQQKRDAVEGKLRQISIEARIVEASTEFSRELGVSWGAGYQNTWGSKTYGVLMGNSSSGTVTSFPNDIGFTSSNVGVNFPSVSSVTSPAIGLILGSSSLILDAQLSALEETGEGKIISSPRVTALEGNSASIEQGKRVPYPTTDSDGNTNTQFEDVVLRLKVTPNITPDGRISMKITAKNEELDWANAVDGQPATSKSAVDSTIVVRDGDTIVIGGVYKTIESKSEEGVPYLSKIPILGWLFKYKSVTKETRELLVFVTPRIMGNNPEEVVKSTTF
jgi:type IV pilus assembly protein PilQ